MSKLIGMIHMAKARLGMDDETYRMFLVDTIGKNSLRGTNSREQWRVMEERRDSETDGAESQLAGLAALEQLFPPDLIKHHSVHAKVLCGKFSEIVHRCLSCYDLFKIYNVWQRCLARFLFNVVSYMSFWAMPSCLPLCVAMFSFAYIIKKREVIGFLSFFIDRLLPFCLQR